MHQPHRRRGRTGKTPGSDGGCTRAAPQFSPAGTVCPAHVMTRGPGAARFGTCGRASLGGTAATRRDVHALGVSLAGDEQSRGPLLHP